MKQKTKYLLGGIAGLIGGLVLFLIVTGNLFFEKITTAGSWRVMLLNLSLPTIIGVLVVVLFNKIRNYIKSPVNLWLIYMFIIILIIVVLIVWYQGLRLAIALGVFT
jgi:hypothetical protein